MTVQAPTPPPHSRDLDDETLARRLRASPLLLLDDSRRTGPCQSLLFTEPVTLLTAASLAQARDLLATIDAAVAQGRWAAGWFGYELGAVFEPRLAALAQPGLPLAAVGIFDAPQTVARPRIDAALAAATGGATHRSILGPGRMTLGPDDFQAQFDRVMGYLQAGDCYQVNLTAAYDFDLKGDPLDLYRRLRARQPAAFGGYLDFGGVRLASLSPELFIHRDGEQICSRPMKGTAPRGQTTAGDINAGKALACDAKSRAENRMIVDLIRNDISRLAEPGSVTVDGAFAVEALPSLWQMTSLVSGSLDRATPPSALLRALFPCGSITGAPKIRAMEIIAELEAKPRGPYCGALGYIAPGARAAFNVAIRTVSLTPAGPQRWRGRLGIGSGLVADSKAAAEYGEWCSKARFLTDPEGPPGLIETLRWTRSQGYFLPDRHLDRMAASAQRFAIRFDRHAAHAMLKAAAPTDLDRARVRLMLSPAGRLGVSVAAFDPARRQAGERAALITGSADSGDIRLYHKTNRRQPYRRALAAARTAGAEVAVLVNEAGHVTETHHANLFVLTDRGWRTPPVACGLLDGVLRSALLQGEVDLAPVADLAEEALTVKAILSSKALYAGNALTGLWPLELTATVALDDERKADAALQD